jgi:hypothetical protein
MMSRRSKFVTSLVVGGVVFSTAVIVVGVIYRGNADAEHARVVHGQAVAENRWEAQAAYSLRTTIRSTMQGLEQPIMQAQATYDSTAGRASEEARESLKSAIAAARNTPQNTLARVDSLIDAKNLSVASEDATKLARSQRDELSNARKVADDQAEAFDAAEAKRKADAKAAAKKATPPATSPGSPQASISTDGKDATAICLSGQGAEGAMACVRAMAYPVSVTFEWKDTGPGREHGWSGTTWIEEYGHPLTSRVRLSNSIAADFGSSPQATSVAMHESGHASAARCHAVADDPVFGKRGARDDPAERFATAYAIAHGAPNRDAAGQSAYDFVSTDAEIAKAAQC